MTMTEERTPSSQQNRLEQTENTEMLVVSLKQILKKKRFSHRQKNKNKWSNKSPNHNSNFFCKAVKKKTKKTQMDFKLSVCLALTIFFLTR